MTAHRLIVWYNTRCPVCDAGIDWQRNKLLAAVRAGQLSFSDINEQPQALAAYGASLDDVRRRLHATDQSDRLIVGADVAIAIWRLTPGEGWPASLFGNPVMLPVTRFAYDRFADLLFAWNRREGTLVAGARDRHNPRGAFRQLIPDCRKHTASKAKESEIAVMLAPLSLNHPAAAPSASGGTGAFSGGVAQNILPWNWFTSFTGNRFSWFTVNWPSSAPESKPNLDRRLAPRLVQLEIGWSRSAGRPNRRERVTIRARGGRDFSSQRRESASRQACGDSAKSRRAIQAFLRASVCCRRPAPRRKSET